MTKKELRNEVSNLRKRVITLENSMSFISNNLGFVRRNDSYGSTITHGAYGSLPQKFYTLLSHLGLAIVKPTTKPLEVRKIKENKNVKR